MNKYIQNELEFRGSFDLGYTMRSCFVAGMLTARYEKQLDTMTEKFPACVVGIDLNSIILHNPSCREETLLFIKTFGGEWNKELEAGNNGTIQYTQDILHPYPRRDGELLYISIRGATPPPSCVVEEYEEEVPATKVMKKRIVCPKGEEAVNETSTSIQEEVEVKHDQEAFDIAERIAEERPVSVMAPELDKTISELS